MATKFVIAAAVPFSTARLQACLNKNIVRKVSEVEKHSRTKKGGTNSSGSRRRMQNLTTEEKLCMRRLKNRATAQASRDKAKLEENLLEQRLFELRYEKMKLLLENEELKRQNNNLEAENENLKFKDKISEDGSMDKGNDVEVAFKHASFVSIPLQKEWVLHKIFFFLMMSVWESVKQNALILNYWTPYISMQLSLNSSLKYLLNIMCLPWKLMIPLAGSQHSPIILNG